MKNVSGIEERQFITKEFADTIAGKTPAPYLRLHDPVQKKLAEIASSEHAAEIGDSIYYDRMIHFWREVSLAGIPRAGRAIDECYALLFESAFDLAEAEPDRALQCLTDNPEPKSAIGALTQLASHTQRGAITHFQLTKAFTGLYAPQREIDERLRNEFYTPFGGAPWFWAAILAASGIDETDKLWAFRCALADSSNNAWGDGDRLHIRLIREAPQRASQTPRDQLMAHPILRIARLKYRQGSVEHMEVLRFLNGQCIKQGFESEEDCFGSDLILAQWTRDARQWATNLLDAEPEVCQNLFQEAGEKAIDRTRTFYYQHLGSDDPACVDAMDATAALIKWAKRRRGFEYSQYRAQLWEFVVEIVDVALWLGWLFPRSPLTRKQAPLGKFIANMPILSAKKSHTTKAERTTKSGAVLLSHNHLALLQALVGFTDHIAPSTKDWINAAVPLASGRFWSKYGTVYAGVKTLHPSWVSRERHGKGNTIAARLLPRGRQILTGEIAAKVKGMGFYVPPYAWGTTSRQLTHEERVIARRALDRRHFEIKKTLRKYKNDPHSPQTDRLLDELGEISKQLSRLGDPPTECRV